MTSKKITTNSSKLSNNGEDRGEHPRFLRYKEQEKEADEELKFWQHKTKCPICQDEIFSSYSGEFVTCSCGNLSVDQTPYYGRYLTNKVGELS